MINDDTTLAERIKTLFREQGVTIASIITAIGMVISTLVLAITGGGGTPTQVPSGEVNSVKYWIKNNCNR